MQDRKWVRKLLKWKSSQVESSTYIVKSNMSDSPHNVRIRMGHKWLKWKELNLVWELHKEEWNSLYWDFI